MRKIALALTLLPSMALAEDAPKPSVEEVADRANSLIAAVRSQRESCNDQAAQLAAQVDKLTKELAAAKRPAVEPKK